MSTTQSTHDPLDSFEHRESDAQVVVQRQREKVAKLQAQERELLCSPQGLRGLFPTNKVRVKLTTKAQKRQEALERLETNGRLHSTPSVDKVWP